MAVNIGTHFLHSTSRVPSSSLLLSLPPISPSSSPHFSRIPISCRVSSSKSASSPFMDPQTTFKELPFVAAPIRDLTLELLSSVETRLGSSLLPCSLPPDGHYFENPNGSSQASFLIRSGSPSSSVDCIVGSWIHGMLPTGGNMNIVTFLGYLKPLTDAPNFLLEIIQNSPTSFALIIDLPPRKDLVLHPEYLKTFYEDTELDRYRLLLEKLPEVRPYVSSSLYIRAMCSPSVIFFRVEAEAGGTTRTDEIIRDHACPIAKEMINIWLDSCAFAERQVGEAEIAYLAKRDKILRNQGIAIDIASSFPRLFGQEVANRAIGVLKENLNV